MTHSLYQHLNLSSFRRAFVVGDIHGEFEKLGRSMEAVSFDIQEDVMIAVGDLVDRGPHSDRFEWWIAQPWFKRVAGNHDLQLGEYLLGYESREAVIGNGGAWWVDKPREEIERMASLLEDAPLALKVCTPGGHDVGITHADVGHRWNWLEGQCQDPDLERYLVNLLTGSRDTLTKARRGLVGYADDVRVLGIDHVFHGHTPLDRPFTCENRTWIDTGACDGGDMTFIDIDQWLQDK